ncbi:ParB/RepB/Spo0J family partition protein [Bosea eneae]|uniref:ParB/RepB/Spo0J family partition protein n=1 Tax=Bosea eneae TaxID=151454 RepID=A0ABW0IXE7_9HYPH
MTQELQHLWPHDLVAGEAVNVRPGDEDVSDLLGSIAAHGLLQPLVGRTREDGTVEIIDGNRRLKALKQLFDDGKLREKVPVMLRAQEADADAFEISLAANVLRRQLHPVVEFEAFAELADKGKSNEEIAEHFGIPLRAVEQRQALGRLHPDIRKAWLEGRINGEAARAFTIASPADQSAYLQSVAGRERWRLQHDYIRRAFTVNSVSADRPIAVFVGAFDYIAAGGQMVPDLFKEKPDFADGGLLERLAQEKLSREAERIQQEEGWAEVLYGSDANQQRYSWDRLRKPALPESEKPARRIEIETRLRAIDERRQVIEDAVDQFEWDDDGNEPPEATAMLREDDALAAERDALSAEHAQYDDERAAWLTLDAEQRGKAVAVIDIGNGGALSIARGYLKDQKPKPAPKPTGLSAPAPKPSSTGEEAPEPARLSAAQLDELALTATRAAAHVVAGHPRLALALFVASAATLGSPVRFRSEGRSEGPALPWDGLSYDAAKTTTFEDVFKRTLLLSIDELQMHTAKCVAHMLDFTSKAINSNSMATLKPAAAQAVRAALPLVDHRAALVQAFDPAEYFSKAPKQEAIAAIRDCGDDPGKHAKLKKADLGAVATRLATERHWLPEILRGGIFEAVLPAEPDGEDDEPGAGDDEESAEPETPASAAEAALEIWLGQERTRLVAMKAPELRELLKERGVSIPFGSTKMQLIELALQHGDPDSSIEEAA